MPAAEPPPLAAGDAYQPLLNLNHDDYRTDGRDWQAAKLLLEELEDDLSRERKHLLMRLMSWLFVLRVFRRIEKRKMFDVEPGARDMAYHRAIITSLLGTGELLLLDLAAHQEVDPESIGFPQESIASTVSLLRADLNMWHGDMKPEMANEILHELFGVAA